MEVKVLVDGLPRVVCGVTEETTCQEVVIALAQALSQPGRYVLQEKFKDFERCMAPNEHVLETLHKYGEQMKEVRLTLLHSGPSAWDKTSRPKFCRCQPCLPLRRKDAGSRMRRGSGSSLHRQSLPPLSCLKQEAEQQKEELKRPKRKSLTLMGEAWEWLESLGRGKVYSTACDKESRKRTDKKNQTCLAVSLTVDDGRSCRSKTRGQKGVTSDLDHQTSCCMGSQTRGKESKQAQEMKSDDRSGLNCASIEDEKNNLRETVICQLSYLQDLQVQIAHIDKQILELEEKQRARKAEQEAQQAMVEEEMEQIKLWENELKAEEGHERDLQCQFLEMRANVAGCKAQLEDYRIKMKGLDFFASQNVEMNSKRFSEAGASAAMEIPAVSTEDLNCQQSDPDGHVNINRKFPPREDLKPPHALVPPHQIKERRPTGPAELREWWKRWTQAQTPQAQTKKKVIHRSELTIYLGSTKVKSEI